MTFRKGEGKRKKRKENGVNKKLNKFLLLPLINSSSSSIYQVDMIYVIPLVLLLLLRVVFKIA